MRFESPCSNNRWDSPLFYCKSDEEESVAGFSFANLSDAILRSKVLSQNQSTQSQPIAAGNFLQVCMYILICEHSTLFEMDLLLT